MCTVLGYCSSKVSEETCRDLLSVASSRGPDMTRTLRVPGGILGFDRLSIMGLTEAGMQPFTRNGNACVGNGELYGVRPLQEYQT